MTNNATALFCYLQLLLLAVVIVGANAAATY
jgi:hypothetical protein